LGDCSMRKVILFFCLLISVSGCGTENSSDTNDTANATNKVLPTASVTIDGSLADWNGIAPLHTDLANDATGNGATDLIEFYAAKTSTKIALLIKTRENIAMPHTPTQNYSHYEVGIHMYTDAYCNNKIAEKDYFIVNNFTQSSGQNYHRIEDYTNSNLVGSQPTETAYATNVLETAFDASIFPSSMKSFQFNVYTQSFPITGTATQHDQMNLEGCYTLP
jgi:hypothetical protein